MEHPNLNSSPDDDDALAAFVRDQLRPLPDDGFSARVLAALPARATAPRHSRIGIVVGTVAALAGLAYALSGNRPFTAMATDLGRIAGIGRELAQTQDAATFAIAAAFTLTALTISYAMREFAKLT